MEFECATQDPALLHCSTRELQLCCRSRTFVGAQSRSIYAGLSPRALRWSLQLVAVVLIGRETGDAEHRAVLTFNSFSKRRATARRHHQGQGDDVGTKATM